MVLTGCWSLAMVAGMLWSRWWTALLSVATAGAFLAGRSGALTGWTGWAQFALLVGGPWLLALHGAQQQRLIRRLQAKQAQRTERVSETSRGLLAFQDAIRQLEAQIVEIAEVYRVTRDTASTLHLHELFQRFLQVVPRLLHAPAIQLIDLTGDTPQSLRAQWSMGNGMTLSQERQMSEWERRLIQTVQHSGAAGVLEGNALPSGLPEGVARVAWAPLTRDQRAIGLLVAGGLPASEDKLLTIIAHQVSLQLSRIQFYQEVEALAVTDALTGLFVRRHFLERTREELVRSQRHGLSCTLLMVDLDHFKEKNDTYGHLVGDVVLQEAAKLLSGNLREVDLCARYGGEEFVILLIETTGTQARPVADRLRQLVEVHPIRAYDERVTQTISVGLAEFPRDAATVEELIERADAALYAAKRAGRNRVVHWSTALGVQGSGLGATSAEGSGSEAQGSSS